MYIDPVFRGVGAGMAILKALLLEAKNAGYKKLDDLDPDSNRWDTTFDEFDKVKDQLIDLQIELEDLEYDGKLTSSQKSRFNRLSTKFDDYRDSNLKAKFYKIAVMSG